MKYRFIKKHQDRYSVGRVCALLGISRSGYYAWKKRKPSQREQTNQALIDHIRRIHKMSRKAYGSPRVYAQLKKQGYTRIPRQVIKKNTKTTFSARAITS